MGRKEPKLTQERLKELLDYNPETGVFTWKIRTSTRVKVGQEAGHANAHTGYVHIKVDGSLLYAHRLAFFYTTGEWPENDVDHINGNRTDNCWNNLRKATRSENLQNSRLRQGNASRFKGVSRHGRGWAAGITINGTGSYLGTFDTPEEAHQAYCTAAKEHFGEFARTS